MKIVFLFTIPQEVYDFLRSALPNEIKIIAKIQGEERLETHPSNLSEIIEETKTAEILMGPYVTEEILRKAHPDYGGKLKLLFIPWTGIDRLNLELLRKYPIQVSNSHGNARTVAEHAIALLLSAAKRIIHHDRLLRNGDWSSRFSNMPSIIIQGKTVGLLGYGAIGTECAKILQGFDVKIIACRKDPKKSNETQRKFAHTIYATEEMDKFLKESDIIINSLPLTQETEGILGENEFNQMRDGIIIINVGRGPTINEDAFYKALEKGKIFAGGLDVQWRPPPRATAGIQDQKSIYFPSKYPLHEFDQIVLSPHRAADVVGGYEIIHWNDVIENIIRIYEGKKPINLVDIEKGY